ncbi:MAG: hypothetical protein H0U95_01125 [Bacteroidetes bacterium]|nr:hypothetical protein [Bacteroidota bacterium]
MLNTSEKPESFAIRCYPTDRDTFKKFATDNHPNQQEAFKDLITKLQAVNNTEIDTLITENTALKGDLTAALNEVVRLESVLGSLILLSEQFKQDTDTQGYSCIETAIEEAKKRQVIKDPAFVFMPSTDIQNNMQRAIIYQIKKGKYSRQEKELPARFTADAIDYYLTNEFTHIKK